MPVMLPVFLGGGEWAEFKTSVLSDPPPPPLSLFLNQSLDLNRFSASRGSIKKSSVGVDFPLQRLSLGDFASDQAGESEGKAPGKPEGEAGAGPGPGPAASSSHSLCFRRKPCLSAVRPVQPLGQRPLRPLHGLVPLPDGLACLQRLSVRQFPGHLRLVPSCAAGRAEGLRGGVSIPSLPRLRVTLWPEGQTCGNEHALPPPFSQGLPGQ